MRNLDEIHDLFLNEENYHSVKSQENFYFSFIVMLQTKLRFHIGRIDTVMLYCSN